jgi:hypothetical protein
MAAAVLAALVLAGPLQPLAAAQRSSPPSAPARPELAAAPDEEFEEDIEPPVDFYDLGAVFMTIVGFPLKAVVCGVGGVVGATLFLITFGSAERASAAVVREGCAQNWIVSGRDLRPLDPPSRAIEWDMQEADGGK